MSGEERPGRLAGFEDRELPGMPPQPPPKISLPPRPVASSSPAPEGGVDPGVSSPVEVVGSVAGVARGRSRASNTLLPTALHSAVERYAAATGMTYGDVIMAAIEDNYDRLRSTFTPPPSSTGAIFGPRPIRAPRPKPGPKAQLNYRLPAGLFAALDQQVVELRAGSRAHLILTALEYAFEESMEGESDGDVD